MLTEKNIIEEGVNKWTELSQNLINKTKEDCREEYPASQKILIVEKMILRLRLYMKNMAAVALEMFAKFLQDLKVETIDKVSLLMVMLQHYSADDVVCEIKYKQAFYCLLENISDIHANDPLKVLLLNLRDDNKCNLNALTAILQASLNKRTKKSASPSLIGLGFFSCDIGASVLSSGTSVELRMLTHSTSHNDPLSFPLLTRLSRLNM